MNKLLNIGRYLFPLSFLIYVGLHLGKPALGASFVPSFLPWPIFWNYITALCILAFIISAIVRRIDKLAYTLMAVYVLLMALMVHLPRAVGLINTSAEMAANSPAREQEMLNVFRNLMTTGALLGFARYVATDKKMIG
jgi:phosphoglycerol transferase MdoB-like AlkP superfamily enzyme